MSKSFLDTGKYYGQFGTRRTLGDVLQQRAYGYAYPPDDMVLSHFGLRAPVIANRLEFEIWQRKMRRLRQRYCQEVYKLSFLPAYTDLVAVPANEWNDTRDQLLASAYAPA